MYSRSQGEAEFVEAGFHHNPIEKRLQTESIVPDVRRYSLFHIGAVSGRPAYVSGICRFFIYPSTFTTQFSPIARDCLCDFSSPFFFIFCMVQRLYILYNVEVRLFSTRYANFFQKYFPGCAAAPPVEAYL